jgi:hypothetical protein
MRTILLTGAVALGLSTGIALGEVLPDGNILTDAKEALNAQTAPRFESIGTVASVRGRYVAPYVAPSWSNPTGQLVRGPNGAISLYAPTDNGGD